MLVLTSQSKTLQNACENNEIYKNQNPHWLNFNFSFMWSSFLKHLIHEKLWFSHFGYLGVGIWTQNLPKGLWNLWILSKSNCMFFKKFIFFVHFEHPGGSPNWWNVLILKFQVKMYCKIHILFLWNCSVRRSRGFLWIWKIC